MMYEPSCNTDIFFQNRMSYSDRGMTNIEFQRFLPFFILVATLFFTRTSHAGQEAYIKYYTPSFYTDSLRAAGTRKEAPAVPSNPAEGLAFTGTAEKPPTVQLPDGILSHEVLKQYQAARAAEENGTLKDFLAGDVNLDRMLGTAAALSPSVRSSGALIEAASKRFGQAAFLDRLVYGYSAVTGSLELPTGPKNNMRMPAMEFPFPGMSSLRAQAVALDVEIARLNYEKNLDNLFSDIELAFADVLYFSEAERITRENLSLARNVNLTAVTMYETGMAAYSDMVMASIREDELEASAAAFSEKRKAAFSLLFELTGLPADARPATLAPSSSETSISRDGFLSAALARNPELLAMRKDIERMDVMIRMIRRELAPDKTLGLSYFSGMNIGPPDDEMAGSSGNNKTPGRTVVSAGGMNMKSSGTTTGAGGMDMDTYGMNGSGGMGGMESFPATPVSNIDPVFAIKNSYAAELEAKKNAMAAGVEDMERRMTSAVNTSYADYSAASGNARAYRETILKSADNAYESALAEYTSGARDFMNLMDALEMTLMKRMDLAMFEKDRRMALAMLGKMAGGRTAPALEGESK